MIVAPHIERFILILAACDGLITAGVAARGVVKSLVDDAIHQILIVHTGASRVAQHDDGDAEPGPGGSNADGALAIFGILSARDAGDWRCVTR